MLAITRKELVLSLLTALLSAFLVHAGFLSILFPIPILISVLKQPKTPSIYFIIISAIAYLLLSLTINISTSFNTFLFDSIVPIIILLLSINIIKPISFFSGFSLPVRIIITAFTHSLLLIFAFIIFNSSISLTSFIENEIHALFTTISELSETNASLSALHIQIQALNVNDLVKKIQTLFMKGGLIASQLIFYLFTTFLSLFFGGFHGKTRLSRIYLYKNRFSYIYIVIASLILISIGEYFSISVLSIPLWNILIPCIFLFILQGIAIILFLIAKSKASFLLRLSILFILTLSILIVSMTIPVLILLAFLGVVEYWIPLRQLINKEPPSTPGV